MKEGLSGENVRLITVKRELLDRDCYVKDCEVRLKG